MSHQHVELDRNPLAERTPFAAFVSGPFLLESRQHLWPPVGPKGPRELK